MTLLLQDVMVTMIALGAAIVLIRNAVTMFRPSRRRPACTSCGPKCEASRTKEAAATVAPLEVLRRHKA
jgi:hypothetical protein